MMLIVHNHFSMGHHSRHTKILVFKCIYAIYEQHNLLRGNKYASKGGVVIIIIILKSDDGYEIQGQLLCGP